MIVLSSGASSRQRYRKGLRYWGLLLCSRKPLDFSAFEQTCKAIARFWMVVTLPVDVIKNAIPNQLRAPGILEICASSRPWNGIYGDRRICPVTPVMSKKGAVRPQVIRTPALDASHQYSLLYSLHSRGALQQESRLEIEVRQSGQVILRKTLHAGDPDRYTQFRPAKAGPAELRIQPSQVAGEFAFK